MTRLKIVALASIIGAGIGAGAYAIVKAGKKKDKMLDTYLINHSSRRDWDIPEERQYIPLYEVPKQR